MADSHAKQHDYHLVEPSPWPVVGAAATFILAVGAIMWMHGAQPWIMLLGLLGILYTMFMWWRDVVFEAHRGDHTRIVQLHLRYGMILFIASEVMFFVAWFWAFFDASLYSNEAIQASRLAVTGGQWPPKGIEVFNPYHLPLLNTL
ncbi:MAG TPA: cytochrome c oxidase subunit 3, partial [Aestuariivirgaceae bacterium]|nr:cytochrome c oxidase subunit 3 [Aestuariivirgaceae bacterium]